MGIRKMQEGAFDAWVQSMGAEPVGSVSAVEHGGPGYKKRLAKIAKQLQALSDDASTGVDWILCELFTVFNIDASIKIRYGKRRPSGRKGKA